MNSSKIQEVESSKVKLVPSFEAEKDITPNSQEVKISDKDLDLIQEICPHFRILEEKYNQYKNPDDEGNPDRVPVPWSPRHSLNTFRKVISQADLSKGLTVQPTRLTKIWVWNPETGKEEPFLEVKLLVVGVKHDGTDTTLTSITVGTYEYPTQFAQNQATMEWEPVNKKFIKHHYLPFTKENVLKYSRWKNGNEQTNPHTKKYVVTHPKKSYSANISEEEFLNITDEQVLRLTEGNQYQKER